MTTPSAQINEFLNGIFPETVFAHSTPCHINFVLSDDGAWSEEQEKYLNEIGIAPDKIQTVHQIHSDIVLKAPLPAHVDWEADALVTDVPGFVLSVRTADCLPVYIYDGVKKAIGLVHAGWKGAKAEIVLKTLSAMFEAYGTKPEDVIVAYGPSISSANYEVGPEFKEHFHERTVETDGKLFFDLAQVNTDQFVSKGVKAENIHNCEICTFHDEKMYSFRRQGKAAGRFMSLMMIKEGA